MSSYSSFCPSRRRCRPCGWRSPTRCRTRTSRAPACRSITLVWSSWKVEECGSWLKSIETFGAVGSRGCLELLLGGALHRRVDFLGVGGALGDELEVDHRRSASARGSRRRRACPSVPAARGRPPSPRRSRSGSSTPPPRGRDRDPVHGVERRLVAGIGMDRGHEAGLDADRVVQHLGDRREAVGGATGVRDDDVVLGQRVVVDAVDDGGVGIVGGAETSTRLAPRSGARRPCPWR